MSKLLPSEQDMLRWMKENAGDYVDECGAVNMTKLAKACAAEFDEWSRLDDPDDSIWDLAFRTWGWWEKQQ